MADSRKYQKMTIKISFSDAKYYRSSYFLMMMMILKLLVLRSCSISSFKYNKRLMFLISPWILLQTCLASQQTPLYQNQTHTPVPQTRLAGDLVSHVGLRYDHKKTKLDLMILTESSQTFGMRTCKRRQCYLCNVRAKN